MKLSFLLFLCALVGCSAFAATPLFLGLSGPAKCTNQDQLLTEVENKLVAPLEKMGVHVKIAYNYLSDNACELELGLIAESKDSEGKSLLANYVRGLEKSGFQGLAVRFRRVARIDEAVTLLAGLHNPSTGDMTINYQTEKSFVLNSVSAWGQFTDTVGKALQSHQSTDFQNYLAWFVGKDYPKFAQEVLAKSDMVGMHLDPEIILENGTVIDEDSGMSPFFDMPFYRDCWAAEYENGMCLSGP
jgi:hypothetical protein